MAYALFMHDLVKLHTLVNRAISIGEYGISEESSQEFSILEKKLMLDTFAQDASLTNFIFTKNRYHTYPNASPITAEFSNRLDTFIYDIYNKH